MLVIEPHDRPREKLAASGAGSLGDNELLAIVLGHGSRTTSALELASVVLGRVGGLHGLTRVTRDELRTIRGLGAAKAAQILAAVELGRRTLIRPSRSRPLLASPREAAAHLIPQFGSRRVEHFGVLLLDIKRRVLRTTIVSMGTLDASVVHPREVFREAASGGAAAIVVFHNHPSGDPTPSPDDVALTTRLVEAGEIMGIDVIDHLILVDSGYFSFREMGRL